MRGMYYHELIQADIEVYNEEKHRYFALPLPKNLYFISVESVQEHCKPFLKNENDFQLLKKKGVVPRTVRYYLEVSAEENKIEPYCFPEESCLILKFRKKVIK